jgi:chemotaxis receptor (MCP) glutamine deamidase CheD
MIAQVVDVANQTTEVSHTLLPDGGQFGSESLKIVKYSTQSRRELDRFYRS